MNANTDEFIITRCDMCGRAKDSLRECPECGRKLCKECDRLFHECPEQQQDYGGHA